MEPTPEQNALFERMRDLARSRDYDELFGVMSDARDDIMTQGMQIILAAIMYNAAYEENPDRETDLAFARRCIDAGLAYRADSAGVQHLMHSIHLYEDPVTLQGFLAAGGDARRLVSPTQFTPLTEAIRSGRLQIARALLDGGADPWEVSPSNVLPIHMAAAFGGPDFLDEVLRAMERSRGEQGTRLLDGRVLPPSGYLAVVADSQDGPVVPYHLATAEAPLGGMANPAAAAHLVRLGSEFFIPQGPELEPRGDLSIAINEPWARFGHLSFSPSAQRVVLTVLLCTRALRPHLPPEIVLIILEFLRRSDFIVDEQQ